MKRYIITGTPTSMIRALELTKASVVSEAATDLMTFRQTQGNMTPWGHLTVSIALVGFLNYIITYSGIFYNSIFCKSRSHTNPASPCFSKMLSNFKIAP